MNIILFDELQDLTKVPRGDFRAKHIVNVLRLKEGETFKTGVINGAKGVATVEKIDSEFVTFSFIKEESSVAPFPITLLVGQVRPICMKRILRESASFGISKLIAVGTDLGERSYRDAKLYVDGEYKNYLLDGSMQSGETAVPQFELCENVDQVLDRGKDYKTKLVFDNLKGAKRVADLRIIEKPVIVAIGSERGFSERERSLFAKDGYQVVTLGQRILRTETACSAALALLLSKMALM